MLDRHSCNYYYLIINEDINSGLIMSQVVTPLTCLKYKDKLKIININKFFRKVNKYDIPVINIPIAIPARLFLFNFFFLCTPLIAFFYSIILAFFLKNNSVIIARSYFATLVSFFISKIKNIEFVFDSRSLFIDENILSGNIKKGSLNYKMWRYFEIVFLKNAQKVIAVSLKQKEFYKSRFKSSAIEIIPCYLTRPIIYEKDKIKQIKQTIGFCNDDIVVCYYGSLDNGWNNIDMYCEVFNELINSSYKILIISQNYNLLKSDPRLKHNSIYLLDTKKLNKNQLFLYMQICDYGIVLMKKSADWETRLSVKFIDYLNNGLQVIVGKYVGEAVRYSKEFFSHRCIIYEDSKSIDGLKFKSKYNDKKLLNSLFGIENINRILD